MPFDVSSSSVLLHKYKFLLLSDIKEQVKHIEKAVVTKEPRFMYRVIRALVSIRRRINHAVLRRLLMTYLGNQPAAQTLCSFLEEVGLYI